MEFLFGHRLERLEGEHAGIVDKNAWRPELGLRLGEQALDVSAL
jgi:hypothetical protein